MRRADLIRREQLLDEWLDSDRASTGELPGEMVDLAEVARLVCQHVTEPGGERQSGRSVTRRVLEVAAVLLLVAGLVLGLVVGTARSGSSGHVVPLGQVSIAAMPKPLEQEVALQAGSSGDPYPSAPVLWVKTTASKIEQYLVPYHFPSQAKLPPDLTEWVAQSTGHFYGDPSTETGAFSSMIFSWVPMSVTATFAHHHLFPGGQGSGLAAVPLGVLEQLGNLHRQYLRAPQYAAAAPGQFTGVPRLLPRGVGATIQMYLVELKPLAADLRLDWAGLTAGQLRSKVPWSMVPASLPANYSVWAVELTERGSLLSPMWLYFWWTGKSFGEHEATGSLDLLGITRLGQLGPVHSIVGAQQVRRALRRLAAGEGITPAS